MCTISELMGMMSCDIRKSQIQELCKQKYTPRLQQLHESSKSYSNGKIAFEMATYNHNENDFANNTAANNQKIEDTLSPSTSPSKSLRKALNENVGYGQFIDENM